MTADEMTTRTSSNLTRTPSVMSSNPHQRSVADRKTARVNRLSGLREMVAQFAIRNLQFWFGLVWFGLVWFQQPLPSSSSSSSIEIKLWYKATQPLQSSVGNSILGNSISPIVKTTILHKNNCFIVLLLREKVVIIKDVFTARIHSPPYTRSNRKRG